MKKSFKLITVLGIPVEINYSWFIIFGLVVYTLAVYYFPSPSIAPDLSPSTYWIMAVISAVLLFACLLLHELSHSYIAKINQLPISGITLFIFGGVAHLEKEPDNPGIEFRMAAAGPLMSIFLGTLFFLLNIVLYSFVTSRILYVITDYLSLLNFAVAIFNLIPGFPLDGGRLLRAAIWHFSGDLRRATFIASSIGKGVAIIMIALGFFAFIMGSILSGLWFIFLGFFLMEAAETSYRQMRMKKILSSVKIQNLMTKNVITVPVSITLDRLVEDYFFKFRFASFPVFENDTLMGLVTFHDIKEVGRENWHLTEAKKIMTPIRDDLLARKDDDLMEAMVKIINNGVGRLLVIEDHKLIGILSQKDIIRLFEFKEEIGE
jgi:Zn-dependent protease/predicted transcriptional regulator